MTEIRGAKQGCVAKGCADGSLDASKDRGGTTEMDGVLSRRRSEECWPEWQRFLEALAPTLECLVAQVESRTKPAGEIRGGGRSSSGPIRSVLPPMLRCPTVPSEQQAKNPGREQGDERVEGVWRPPGDRRCQGVWEGSRLRGRVGIREQVSERPGEDSCGSGGAGRL